MSTSWGSPHGFWLVALGAVLVQTLALVVSVVFFNRVLHTAMATRLEKEISSGVTNKLTDVLPFLPDGHVGPSDVAAHVTATSTAAVSTSSQTQEEVTRSYLGERVTVWEGRRGQSFLHNVELRGGELLVPRAGLYFIYAQTYFRLSSDWNKEQEEEHYQDQDQDQDQDHGQDGAQLVQYIYKKMSSYTAPILLMKSSRSACWPRGREPGMFSLNQAGTAFLQPEDRLFVAVGNASALEADGRASYFGAFLVG
ncbi:tumor necrosis factor ligand superfamily member 10-like isoform X3 [Stigmatopora argus]